MLHIESSAVINARAQALYAIVADYPVGHNAILPRSFFQEMTVEKGGRGAGTVFYLRTKMLGQITEMRQTVSEPEPGRVIQENDLNSGLVTRFIFDPVDDGQQTRVTITTDFPTSAGFKGLVERLLMRLMFPPIYKQELDNLAAYAAQTQAAAQPNRA